MSSDLMYDRYKEQHRCARCGAYLKPEYTKITCPDCIAKTREHVANNREHYSQYFKKRREYRKARGLCTRCGKPKDNASKDFLDCFECRVKAAETRRIKREKEAPDMVAVIRCKYCENGFCVEGDGYICQLHKISMHSDSFCSFGHKKDVSE